MAIRRIIKVGTNGDEVLHKETKLVTEFDEKISELIDDMFDTLEYEKNGVGLACPQIGILKSIFVLEFGKNRFEFVNPKIIESSKRTKICTEACLSVPRKVGKVRRPISVKVSAQDRTGKFFELQFKGFEAQAVSHECDHLKGIMYTDIME